MHFIEVLCVEKPMRRTIFRIRLPLALFITTILVLCGASYAIFYITFTTHIRGDYFRLENKHIETVFPRNWLAIPSHETNSNGTIHSLWLAAPYVYARMIIKIYDQNAAKAYLKQNNLTDAFSIIIFETEMVRNTIMQKNENASLVFIKNGTLSIFGLAANFTEFVIKRGLLSEDGEYYDWDWTIISLIDNKIIQIIFHGKEADYHQAYHSFQYILNSTKISEEE